MNDDVLIRVIEEFCKLENADVNLITHLRLITILKNGKFVTIAPLKLPLYWNYKWHLIKVKECCRNFISINLIAALGSCHRWTSLNGIEFLEIKAKELSWRWNLTVEKSYNVGVPMLGIVNHHALFHNLVLLEFWYSFNP